MLDLLMLSLMNKNANNIVLIRDNSFQKENNIDYIEIKTLSQYIYNDFVLYLKSEVIKTRIINDYILICFMLGNDFLERIPNLSIRNGGIETVMKTYANAWKGEYLIDLTKTQYINIEFLKDIFYQLKSHENFYFKNFKYNNINTLDINEITNIQQHKNVEFYKEDIIKYKDENYKFRYYIYYHIHDINKACYDYIEGLYWVFGYYNGHVHDNWEWYYKYHNTPFSSDIFDFLKSNQNLNISISKSKVYSGLKQLLIVLPKTSLKNILNETQINTFNVLFNSDEYFPDNLYIDMINKRYLWLSFYLIKKIYLNMIFYTTLTSTSVGDDL